MPDKNAVISVRGARQNNLKNLDLDFPLNALTVVTGVSGSGKSSLVFDTLYAEGQRRYVETFSPYARQFLDRMDKPKVDSIAGVPPAIAIDQTNPVRTSRSTVGTMTELNDHLKLLFARAARLYCRRCAHPVQRDDAQTIAMDVRQRLAAYGAARVMVTFPIAVPESFTSEEIIGLLKAQGYTRFKLQTPTTLEVVQDRLRFTADDQGRLQEALESALRVGQGRVSVHVVDSEGVHWPYSSGLHCPRCDIHYQDPTPSLFSFNSPLGACDNCRGFGRTMGIDYDLVIPDVSKSLRMGAVRPWQSESYRECQDDLIKFARKRGIPLDTPWRRLTPEQQSWVLDGEGSWEDGLWYGARRFFAWLETKSYKMHIRVLLSKYRTYATCPACGGARLKLEPLLWRIGTEAEVASNERGPFSTTTMPHCPVGAEWSASQLMALRGLNIYEIMCLPIDGAGEFFSALQLPPGFDEAGTVLLAEIRARLRYLMQVGLGYLTLDRQSRTLSGGEVQRVNLTTALGTSLVNTLFVLDEPSIGLHPRDMDRVIGVMKGLQQAGNTLVVVEHDPQIMMAADYIVDIGPGPGRQGGQVVYSGSARGLLKHKRSLTAAYLNGRLKIATHVSKRTVHATDLCLELRGARQHNLQNVDLRIPLQRLVCITGVSGSGKSTLIQDVLYPALLRIKGKPTATPGYYSELLGHEHVSTVVMIDQSPIGRTTRSTPASYVGAFDGIRRVFADTALARDRGYTLGTFSFNAGSGRCPTCGGNGFEHIEMQFLSDIYLRCPDCDGKRYRSEILEVTVEGANGEVRDVAQVLELTVAEAIRFFEGRIEIVEALQPLADVGLDYLQLGQPVPTLSGGEAQRLKLASHLVSGSEPLRASVATGTTALLLFDEPTTGLHFDDIAKLLGAFRRLVAAGQSVIVIEHNLDVIGAADWIVDLGPDGGVAGGRLVCEGTVDTLRKNRCSHTGRALSDYELALQALRESVIQRGIGKARKKIAKSDAIAVRNAREHNLQNVDVDIPHDKLTVITGVSGSGKSTLAFDIVFNEGQRRYLESLNAYARQFVQPASRPDVDAVLCLPPTVAIEQRTSRGGRKSTVATLTEVYHFLRLLYVKLGMQHCPDCDLPIQPQSEQAIVSEILRQFRGKEVEVLAPLITARKGYYTDLAAWAAAKGYVELKVDGKRLPTGKWPRLDRFQEHNIDLPIGRLRVTAASEQTLLEYVVKAVEFGKGLVYATTDDTRKHAVYSVRRACPRCATSFPDLDPRLFSYNSKHGWCDRCFGVGTVISGFDAQQTGEEDSWVHAVDDPAAEIEKPCPVCQGARLNRVARAVRLRGKTIAELVAMNVVRVSNYLKGVKWTVREQEIARDILAEMVGRLGFLEQVGLGYLALDRSAPSLSGGEAQRIRLAAQLGSNLRGVCYILDEPTIGLHPRDNAALLETLKRLRDKGNTLLVVEHDEDTIRQADHVIDLGPGAGARGGHVIASGTASKLQKIATSVTGRFLREPLRHPPVSPRVVARGQPALAVKKATLHNLTGIDVIIPVGRLVCITGVSGSGKSTLARQVVYANLRRRLALTKRAKFTWTGCAGIDGWEHVQRILEVDQTPIGKTPRSCPATYIGFWDTIRKLYAETQEARMRGFTASRFSFNTGAGRCSACEGQGMRTVEMSFLPNVKVLCDVCNGQRFNSETLSVRYRGKSIGEVLQMNVDDAVEFFSVHKTMRGALLLLQDMGLGYLTLGQQSPTLSGGEAQRIKLVTELAKVRQYEAPSPGAKQSGYHRHQHTLYVLDEPTVGLHMADVELLIKVLHRLVAAGNSVMVVEHNLDLMAAADWLLDLGPEGGEEGGRVVFAGPPHSALKHRGRRSHTAQALAAFLNGHRAA